MTSEVPSHSALLCGFTKQHLKLSSNVIHYQKCQELTFVSSVFSNAFVLF